VKGLSCLWNCGTARTSAESRPYSRQGRSVQSGRAGRSVRHFRSPQGHGIWGDFQP